MKNNRVKFNIYKAMESDAWGIWNLKRLLHGEGEFLRLSPQEKEETIDDERRQIQSCKYGKRLILVARDQENMIGYLSAFVSGSEAKITKVTLGILQEYQTNGIGSALIKEMENWAYNSKIKEIEMKVMTHNVPALGLYQKLGYPIIGTNPPYRLYDDDMFVQDYSLNKKL